MGNADRNASSIAKPHEESTVPVHMTVENRKGPMLSDYIAKTVGVLRQFPCSRSVMYLSAESKNFPVIVPLSIATNQEMKLKLISVDVPHHVHEPGLYAPTRHTSNDVQYF
jgi:hypothetical protein